LESRRSVVKLREDRAARRVEHWQNLVIAACEQCGRNAIPVIEAPVELSAWLKTSGATEPGARWMLHPDGATRVRDLQATPPGELLLAVGPEGGFGEIDLDALHGAGFRGLSLGPRILRTETAGVVAIAALQALYGDL
jgi:16S rRNA (uracil1498-N3)-methyltransferase